MIGRGGPALVAARAMIGRRVRWTPLHGEEGGSGTISGLSTTSNGWVRWVVDWDDGTPEWWSSLVSPGANGLVVDAVEG